MAHTSRRMLSEAGRRRASVLLWVLVLVAAAAVRLRGWWEVFGPDRTRFLVDTDPHYHVLRALRIVRDFPHVPWSDPWMNYPVGAAILWPPLFDLLIAVPAKALGGTPAMVERVAAGLPVVLGLVALALVGRLGVTLLGRREAFIAVGLLAFLPASVEFTILGRPDQHAMELVASCWTFLSCLSSWRARPGTRWAGWGGVGALGLGIAVSFWNWQGSGLYLVVLAGFAGLWHVAVGTRATPAPSGTLAWGAGAGTLLLAISLALFAPGALRATTIMGVTGFHVILSGLTCAFAALIHLADRLRPRETGLVRRAVEAGIAAVLPAAAVLALFPGFRDGVSRALLALRAGNAWYAGIQEFDPLLLGGWDPLRVELGLLVMNWGLTLAALPLCVPAFVRAWRARPGHRPELAFLLYWGGLLLALTLARRRFQLYGMIPATLCVALGLAEAGRWLHDRLGPRGLILSRIAPAVGALLVVGPALAFPAYGRFAEGIAIRQSLPALQWLHDVPSAMGGRDGVLAPWELGHAVQYFAGKPVVVTPFGTDGGDGAMEDVAAFYLAPNADAAEQVLERRRVGFVLLLNPVSDVHMFSGFVRPVGSAPVRLEPDIWRGGALGVTDAFWPLPVARLYLEDGSGVPQAGVPGLGAYRLLFETRSARPRQKVEETQAKLFGVVRGAVLAVDHAQPGQLVAAAVPLLTNQGRAFSWVTVSKADMSGRTNLRVPYATGWNGGVRALVCTVTDGFRTTLVDLSEGQVAEGATLHVDLGSGHRQPTAGGQVPR